MILVIPKISDQLDVSLIDNALLETLHPRLFNMLKYFPRPSMTSSNDSQNQTLHLRDVGTNLFLGSGKKNFMILWNRIYKLVMSNDEDIISVLAHILFFYCTIGNHRQTPAMKSLGLCLEHVEPSICANLNKVDEKTMSSKTRNARIGMLCFSSIILPKFYQALMTHDLSEKSFHLQNQHVNRNIRTKTDNITCIRRKKVLQYIQLFLHHVMPSLTLLNYVTLLLETNGSSDQESAGFLSYSVPELAMRFAGVRYTTDGRSKQLPTVNINYMYAYRKLLYVELLRTLWAISPVLPHELISLNIMVIKERIKIVLSGLMKRWCYIFGVFQKARSDQHPELFSIPCTICNVKPIAVPYITSCKHLFCYYCLHEALMENDAYHCGVCGKKVVSSAPVLAQGNA